MSRDKVLGSFSGWLVEAMHLRIYRDMPMSHKEGSTLYKFSLILVGQFLINLGLWSQSMMYVVENPIFQYGVAFILSTMIFCWEWSVVIADVNSSAAKWGLTGRVGVVVVFAITTSIGVQLYIHRDAITKYFNDMEEKAFLVAVADERKKETDPIDKQIKDLAVKKKAEVDSVQDRWGKNLNKLRDGEDVMRKETLKKHKRAEDELIKTSRRKSRAAHLSVAGFGMRGKPNPGRVANFLKEEKNDARQELKELREDQEEARKKARTASDKRVAARETKREAELAQVKTGYSTRLKELQTKRAKVVAWYRDVPKTVFAAQKHAQWKVSRDLPSCLFVLAQIDKKGETDWRLIWFVTILLAVIELLPFLYKIMSWNSMRSYFSPASQAVRGSKTAQKELIGDGYLTMEEWEELALRPQVKVARTKVMKVWDELQEADNKFLTHVSDVLCQPKRNPYNPEESGGYRNFNELVAAARTYFIQNVMSKQADVRTEQLELREAGGTVPDWDLPGRDLRELTVDTACDFELSDLDGWGWKDPAQFITEAQVASDEISEHWQNFMSGLAALETAVVRAVLQNPEIIKRDLLLVAEEFYQSSLYPLAFQLMCSHQIIRAGGLEPPKALDVILDDPISLKTESLKRVLDENKLVRQYSWRGVDRSFQVELPPTWPVPEFPEPPAPTPQPREPVVSVPNPVEIAQGVARLWAKVPRVFGVRQRQAAVANGNVQPPPSPPGQTEPPVTQATAPPAVQSPDAEVIELTQPKQTVAVPVAAQAPIPNTAVSVPPPPPASSALAPDDDLADVAFPPPPPSPVDPAAAASGPQAADPDDGSVGLDFDDPDQSGVSSDEFFNSVPEDNPDLVDEDEDEEEDEKSRFSFRRFFSGLAARGRKGLWKRNSTPKDNKAK